MAKVRQTEFHKVFLAEQKDETLVVIPQGDAIGFRDSDIHGEMKTLLALLDDKAQFVNLVVDLKHAEYFGSTILGGLNSLGLKVRDAGGSAALCNVSEEMRSILKVMNLDSLWPNFNSRKAALKFVKDSSDTNTNR
jgi:anti-anti-sigma factor